MVISIVRFSMVVVVGFFLQACGKLAPESSCNFVRNSSKQRVSWTQARLPVKVHIHESVPRKHHEDLKAAADFWNNKSEVQLIEIVSFFVKGNSAPKRDGINMVTWQSQWEEAKKNEQARTTINWSKNSIYEADIKVNGQKFEYVALDEELEGTVIDFTSLMIHEFGHVLGLTHNEDNESVMKAKLGFSEDRQEAENIVDINSLTCEYPMREI